MALVVIDVQLGKFDAPGEPLVSGGERLLERIRGLIGEAREARAPVVYWQHCDGPGICSRRAPTGGKFTRSSLPSRGQIIAHPNEVLGGWSATVVNADEVRFEEPAAR